MVRWPGKIKPASESAAIVGCYDIYPTILELTGIARPSQQRIDGVSYAPVLQGTGPLKRDAYFIWFPHLVPGVSVRQGDWKLIRRFSERPSDYEGLHELFNLKDDLGETKNLAKLMPEKVDALNTLIDSFLRESEALLPKPNPAHRSAPKTSKQPMPENDADPFLGLVQRSCKLSPIAGGARVVAQGRTPFLGTAQVKTSGNMTLKLRARSASGGPCKVQWTTTDQADFPTTGQTADVELPAGEEWREISVDVNIDGALRIIRLHLPADRAPVDIASIEFRKDDRILKRWDFANLAP